MAALHDALPRFVQHINLGGLHHREDRTERLRYIYLDAPDEALLRRLGAEGTDITAQDLPTTVSVSLEALLR